MGARSDDARESADPQGPQGAEPVAEYVESLQRIALGLSSGQDLRGVLQQIVDAICDHTRWQLSWIYAMDMNGGYGEIVARRDRMAYTDKSSKERWSFGGNAAIDSLRRNEIIAIPDARRADSYPGLKESAIARGVVAAANIPLGAVDPDGRPMVLCVQSRYALLEDETQIPFLMAVASLASLASTNAALLTEARRVAANASATAELLSSTIESVFDGAPSPAVLSEIEAATGRTMIIVDRWGNLLHGGKAPVEAKLTDHEWGAWLQESRGNLCRSAMNATDPDSSGPSTISIELPNGVGLRASVTGFGNGEPWSAVGIFIDREPRDETDYRSHAAQTATAMVLLRERLMVEVKSAERADIVQQIIEGQTGQRYEFTARAARAGIDVNSRFHLLVAQPLSAAEAGRQGRVEPAMRVASRAWAGSVVHSRETASFALLPAGPAGDEGRLEAFIDSVEQSEPMIITRSAEALSLEDVALGWGRCRQTIDLAIKLGRVGFIQSEEFGAYRVLLASLQSEEIDDFIRSTVGPILNTDSDNQAGLFSTAEAFSAAGGRYQETARRLHIHVSTLRYRLQRINALLSKNINDEETLFEVSLAIRLERLRQGPNVAQQGSISNAEGEQSEVRSPYEES